MKVCKIALVEISEVDSTPPRSHSLKLISNADRSIVTFQDDSDQSSPFSNVSTPSPLRCRAVSFCSQDIDGTSRLSPRFSMSLVKESPDVLNENGVLATTTTVPTSVSTPELLYVTEMSLNPSKKLKSVGDKIHGSLKATLRKKFSWKSYPELEGYLIEHRPKYLQYSSRLNYTAEQKRFNNILTQGLLDLAAEQGYLFEDFTFAAVRDRIRCYYKSYVQATKKKKRRKRR
jgi:hypothetical protein